MKKIFSSILLFAACAAGISMMQSCTFEDEYVYGKGLYTINWEAAADSAMNQLVNHYWSTDRKVFTAVNDDWDFNTSVQYSYWPQAHAIDVVCDAYKRTGDAKYKQIMEDWFANVNKRCNWADHNSFRGEYYDDSAWMGLALFHMYEATKDDKYLAAAKDVWAYLQSAWDEELGGLAWATSHVNDRNSCTHGPATILGAYIYQVTKDQADLDWTKRIFDWEYEYLYNPANGAVADGYSIADMSAGGTYLSYNQGTFAGAAYELYKITGEISYLNAARKALYFGISSASIIDTGNNIIRDEGNNHNNELFKGIFMRYFAQVILEPNLDEVYKNKFVTFLTNNADVLWRKGVIKNDVQMFFSPNWAQPIQGTTSNMEAQVAGCTLLEAKALYEKSK